MSLRYRLFLLVSGLFVIGALCSYFIENGVTKRGLQKAQDNMRAQIVRLSEKQRVDLQGFLASALAEGEEKINAILTNLSSFAPQAMRFGPTMGNSQDGTWEEAADIMIEYKWLDFLQNTNQGKVTAAIIPRQTSLGSAYKIDMDQDLSWIYGDDLQAHPMPYLGIRIPYSLTSRIQDRAKEVPEKISGKIPEAYLLFDAQEMMSESKQDTQPIFQSQDSWPPISVKWTEGYVIELSPFVKAFQRARDLLVNQKMQLPQYSADQILEKMGRTAEGHHDTLSPVSIEASFSGREAEKWMQERLEEIASNYTQISLIWAMIAMYESGLFGNDLFAFPSPRAITLFDLNNAVGMVIDTQEVLSSERLFDDESYFKNNPPKNADSNLGSSIAVMTLPHSERVYLGNTAQFIVKTPEEDRVGYLTLGIDVDVILQRLVFAVQQAAVLVHDGKAISAYAEDGKELKPSPEFALPFSQMLGEKSGIVSWNQHNYFFMHIQPFPNVDLHFFLLNLEEVQFAVLRELQNSSKQIIDSVVFNIHMTGLVALIVSIFLLHRISRRITDPIIQLANATEKVAQGQLDEIQLSLPALKHKDEIAMLCHSFEEMVKGLKEKEKVKGVLNKVVSCEIAQEILKGNVHLGGEVKKVTVLFADIRDFTKMTQNMPPEQIIEMLNGCMTTIAHVIDKNGGVIDKFVGDETMALFGAPISRDDAALKAVIAAIDMIAALKNWNLQRRPQGLPDVEMGIGIHTGPMLAGNMGAENRLNYTVIGSNVNMASRVCDAAKRMEILITKDTLDEPLVKESVVYEILPPMALKGFDKQIEIFRVVGIR